MENRSKKSKALIITIIAILLIVLIGYLLIKNRDSLGVKTSASISRIFSPLIPSLNSKNLNQIDKNSKRIIAEAGEDIKNGDNVFLSSSSGNGNPIAMLVNGNNQSQQGDVFGFANEDILNGDTGEIIVNPNDGNTFWESISVFFNNLFGNEPTNTNTMPNGGWVFDEGTGSWNFDSNGNGGWVFDSDTGDWTSPIQCSDTKDNDGDNLIDTLDPGCHVGGVIEGSYLPNHYSESSDLNNNEECANGATNYPICTIEIGSECTNGATNPPACDNNVDQNNLPDLKAGPVNPTNGTINTPIVLSSLISNIGNGSTGGSFSSFFNITTTNPNIENNSDSNNTVSKNKIKNTIIKIANKIPWVAKAIGATQPGDTLFGLNIDLKTIVPILLKGNEYKATVIYNFNTERTYYVRACADKSGQTDTGTIEESNENNNCSSWTTITITNSLPVEGDKCVNGADNYPTCTTKNGECLNGATNPPLCTNTDETTPVDGTEINQCLLIDQNPLTFTDGEKAELATLLRKFYLIAPSLKTADDINLIYTEIESYEEFASQLDGLINQCYDEWKSTPETKMQRRGNPWHKYNERGSYLDYRNYTAPPDKCIGEGNPGGHGWSDEHFVCSEYTQSKYQCEYFESGGTPYVRDCTWVEGKVDLIEYEQILNIW